MQITVNVEITPEEMRTLMGWPDVQRIQDEALDKIREKMDAGAEGYDPLSLIQPLFAQSASSMEGLQKLMASMMTGFSQKGSGS